MVGTKENLGDLPALILLASRVGIDEVYLQRLVYPLDGQGEDLPEATAPFPIPWKRFDGSSTKVWR